MRRRPAAPAPRCPGRPRILRGALLAGVLLTGVLASAACGSGNPGAGTAAPAPSPTPAASGTAAPDPAAAPYCAAVARAQAEQTAPGAGQGGVAIASDAARRQVDELAAVAPPEIAPQWQTLRQLTEQALGAIAATGGDPARIDRGALTRLEQDSRPAVERIKTVTSQRCGIAFRPPA